jgi:phage/plasmid-like protein (TIGR03299 family)
MSHELDFSKGSAAIAYRGEVPWHGFGNVIGANDSIKTIQKKAGLDYEVHPTPSLYMFNDELREVKNRVQLVRSDTGESLSEMSGSNYKIRQPAEVLEFFKNLCDGGGLQINVAGALHGGKKVWALAERVGAGGTIGNDLIKPYILLVDSYDGTHATTARWTSVRVVCQNTLSFSEQDRKTQTKRKHSQEFGVDGMQLELGEFDKSFKAYVETLKAMTKVKMTDDKLQRFFAKIYCPEVFKDEEKWTNSILDFEDTSTNKRNQIADLFNLNRDNLGAELPSANNTLYGALQTVTFFQDHIARTKGNKRFESATIGAGNRFKDDAHELALSLI